MYKLFLSTDLGVSYHLDGEYESLMVLRKAGECHDHDLLRWVIVVEGEDVLEYCAIHNLTVKNLEEQKDTDGNYPMMVTEDAYLYKRLEKLGVRVLTASELLHRVQQEKAGLS